MSYLNFVAESPLDGVNISVGKGYVSASSGSQSTSFDSNGLNLKDEVNSVSILSRGVQIGETLMGWSSILQDVNSLLSKSQTWTGTNTFTGDLWITSPMEDRSNRAASTAFVKGQNYISMNEAQTYITQSASRSLFVEGEVNTDHQMIWKCCSYPIEKTFGIPLTQKTEFLCAMGTTVCNPSNPRGNLVKMSVPLINDASETSISVLDFKIKKDVLQLYQRGVGTMTISNSTVGFLSFGDVSYLDANNQPVQPPVGMRVRLTLEYREMSDQQFPVLKYQDYIDFHYSVYFPIPYYKPNHDIDISVYTTFVSGNPLMEVLSYSTNSYLPNDAILLISQPLHLEMNRFFVPNDGRFLSIQFTLRDTTKDAYRILYFVINGTHQLIRPLSRP